MKNPYRNWVQRLVREQARGAALPRGGFAPPRRPQPGPRAGTALLFSPHPDDECIVGGLALRLRQERRMRIVNVAVTFGSLRERRAERERELAGACAYLGFECAPAAPGGLEEIRPETRLNRPKAWAETTSVIARRLRDYAPNLVFLPHAADWNRTHIGVHLLVTDALRALPGFAPRIVETEFWGAMDAPNLLVEIAPSDVADLVAALTFHVGEIRRNPYHLRLPAWMQDNVRRGAELVGGQGGAAPAFDFATLYRIGRWNGEGIEPDGVVRRIAAGDDLAALFEG